MTTKPTQAERIRYLQQRLEEMKADLEWGRQTYEYAIGERNEAVSAAHRREQHWYKIAVTFNEVARQGLLEGQRLMSEGVRLIQHALGEAMTGLAELDSGEAPDLAVAPEYERLDPRAWSPPYGGHGGFYRGFDQLT